MARRFFNTAGPCRPKRHYMLPAEQRVASLRSLIDDETYFVLHASRQVGKTTSLRALAEALTAEGTYAALYTSCETGQKLIPELGIFAQRPERVYFRDRPVVTPRRGSDRHSIWTDRSPSSVF